MPTLDDNTVSIKEYIDLRINHIKESIRTAHEALTIRLEGMNEIRGQLTEQANRFATKEFVDGIDKRVQELRELMAVGTGRRAVEAPMVDTVLKLTIGVAVGWILFQLSKG